VRHRFERHHTLGLGLLSLIEPVDRTTKPDGKVGCFDERPGQILIPVLGVALAFLLAVADLLTAHTPTVRSEVSHTGKSPYVSGLQHDGERQNLSDPRHRRRGHTVAGVRPEY